MKELLIIVAIVVIGSQVVRAYNAYEEPQASRILRLAAAEFPESK